jgi:septum formation protein
VRLVLASASPARLRTLRDAGIQPDVVISDVDESAVDERDAATLTQLLATMKAQHVAARISGQAIVLGCDSLLELDGRPLGKPRSAQAAALRWQGMRGRDGVLHTGHCLLDVAAGRCLATTVSTSVRFADVTDEEINAYCTSGEPAEVAGAFTVDGLGGWFVESIAGDHHNVVGVSLPAVRAMLRELGYSLMDLGYPATGR